MAITAGFLMKYGTRDFFVTAASALILCTTINPFLARVARCAVCTSIPVAAQDKLVRCGRGRWLDVAVDTSTHGSLLETGNFVRTLEKRLGLQAGSPAEIAYEQGWIPRADLVKRAALVGRNDYGRI